MAGTQPVLGTNRLFLNSTSRAPDAEPGISNFTPHWAWRAPNTSDKRSRCAATGLAATGIGAASAF